MFAQEGFSELQRLVEEMSGIALGPDKVYLALSRLRPMLDELQVNCLGALAARARAEPGRELASRIVNALATHETSFFRDPDVFALVRTELLPPLRACGRPIRLWCAACATGQEPYSLAMTLLEAGLRAIKGEPLPEILATDVSGPVVFEAMSGVYDRFAIARGVSPERLLRFFEPKGADRWQVKPEVRQLIRFKQANLLEDQAVAGPFDLVLVRNVLIYFSDATRAAILARMARLIRPGGHLILGSSEMLAQPPNGFERLPNVHRPILRRRGPNGT